jgi:hypothetical protein
MTAALLLERVSYSVPELTGSASIKLNPRVQLRLHFDGVLMENEEVPTR